MKQGRTRYTTVAIALHWLIAAAIIFQIILGWRMEGNNSPTGFAVFQLHKSIGITILVLSLARLAWRLFSPPPPAPPGRPRWESAASAIVHWGFYVVMIGLPLTGWIIVSASKLDIPTVLYGVIPWPHLPGLHELAPAAREVWEEGGETAHGLLVKLTYGLLALHIGAVLKHQFIDRDQVFAGMAPGARGGRWLEPRLWLVAIAAALLVVGAYAYGPRTSSAPPPPAAEQSEGPGAEIPAPVAAPPATDAVPEAAASVPEAAKSPVWTVAKSSTLAFTASWSGEPVEGSFRRWDAEVTFDPASLKTSKIRVSVDVASAVTGDAQRDTSLVGAEWFDAATHPKAVFTSETITSLGGDRYVARGRLQMHGQSRPLRLPFSLKITGDKAAASGSAELNRTDFGVGWPDTDEVAAAVKVRFNLTATRKPAAG